MAHFSEVEIRAGREEEELEEVIRTAEEKGKNRI